MHDRQRARHWPEWLRVTRAEQPQEALRVTPQTPPTLAGRVPAEQVQERPPGPVERGLVQAQKAPAERAPALRPVREPQRTLVLLFAAGRRRNWYKRQPLCHWPHHRQSIAWSQGRQPQAQPPQS